MTRKAKTDYETQIQIQKDEEEISKQLNEWMIHYEEKENATRIRLHISSGKAWNIMHDLGIEITGYHKRTNTDVYTLTTEQLINFIHIFFEINSKTIKPTYIPKKRKPRSDKGEKRTNYIVTQSERGKRAERISKINERKTGKK